jgi:signal peptidase I
VGFGYLYVGRFGLAVALYAAALGALALFSWTRLALVPSGLYTLLGLGIAIGLVMLVHPVLIAARNRRAPRKAYNRWWAYAIWSVCSLLACNVIVGIRSLVFGIEPYHISSAAMSPTLEAGDLIMTDAWRYRDREPVAGDVVVLTLDDSINFVKRVVGLPGDRLEIRAGTVYRNGAPLEEPYLHEPPRNQPFERDVGPLTLGADEYFVLGDFRDNSQDSRTFGPVRREQFVGRVELIWFSASEAGIDWSRFPRYVASDP